jgi:thiosulfate/3-mercaptopyruvate sulfurtransferase
VDRGILLGGQQLDADLAGPAPPVVLDVRWRLGDPTWGRSEYLRGHVPGAQFVDLDSELASPPGRGGRHPLPEPAVFAAAMRRSGVRGDRAVVVYDAADSTSAARAWWLLRDAGHPEVHVLDGGLRAWVDAGLPLEQTVRPVPAGDFRPHPGRMPVIDAAGAPRVAAAGVLLDARTADRFRGEVEPVDPVPGHIPDARSVPALSNLDERGRFLDPAVLRRQFAELGAAPGGEVAAYCGSGVTACQTLLALALAGVDGALYPGSWSEWIVDPARPVATGG